MDKGGPGYHQTGAGRLRFSAGTGWFVYHIFVTGLFDLPSEIYVLSWIIFPSPWSILLRGDVAIAQVNTQCILTADQIILLGLHKTNLLQHLEIAIFYYCKDYGIWKCIESMP